MRHIFLVNPVAGNEDKTDAIRNEVDELSRELDFEYLFFIVEYEGHESILTERICDAFRGEPIRIYVCGGSGSFQRVLDAVKQYKNVELASYPCGFTNDLLKCFKDKSSFYKLRNLVTGVPMSLDMAEFDGCRFCNALSIGMTARVIGDIEDYSLLIKINRNFPYWFSSMVDVFTAHGEEYEIDIDGTDYSGNYLVVSAFNGCVYGGNISPAKDAKPNDGLLDFIMFKKSKPLDAVKSIGPFCAGDLEKMGEKIKLVRGKKMKIRKKNKQEMTCNIDGEFYKASGFTEICIKPGAMKLIVPEAAELK